jgi:hypothetical protein
MATVSRHGATDMVNTMGGSEIRAERIETLQRLLGRLCAPDLTIVEAKSLRTRLIDLLEQIDRDAAPPRDVPSQPTDRVEVPKS